MFCIVIFFFVNVTLNFMASVVIFIVILPAIPMHTPAAGTASSMRVPPLIPLLLLLPWPAHWRIQPALLLLLLQIAPATSPASCHPCSCAAGCHLVAAAVSEPQVLQQQRIIRGHLATTGSSPCGSNICR
jgi:hypothetical protein